MSQYKSKHVFRQTLDQTEPDSEELTATQQFSPSDKFVPAPHPDTEKAVHPAEPGIEHLIRPSARKRRFLPSILTAFVGLAGWQAVDAGIDAYQAGDWLSIGWYGFLGVLAGAGAGKLIAEWRTLRRLRQHFSHQTKAEALIQANSVGQAKPFCEQLIKNAGIAENHPDVVKWRSQLNHAFNDIEVFDLYDLYILKSVDEKAIRLISRSASESAVLVAASPLAIADMLLVAWRNLTMLNQLSQLYGVKLGYWSRIRLMRTMFVNMAAAGASEMVLDVSTDLLSAGVAAKLSARAGQGMGIGILTARLGLQAMTLLRPLPWVPERKVRLTAIRQAIMSRVKGLITKSSE
ncbi:hypothetical protein VA7868_01257 [Vibrio aerogenes CECT 7868]|uniref:Uncharacterized protein n=1 Tax=Vibrio aerogenes CECT 7868 TaxID=1216006 RepID=A0A1M5XQI6_9VIBR|nr:TIGR01620 family protein [Vibrio aerogenes]SHI01932.1 hypothetical protein VA7868_01257 [Vibrio aerogenes CECT 7868]